MRKMKIFAFKMCINCLLGVLMKTNPTFKSKTTNHKNIRTVLQFALIQPCLRKNTRRKLVRSSLDIFSIIIGRNQSYLML